MSTRDALERARAAIDEALAGLEPAAAAPRPMTVTVDPGHGGTDPGAHTAAGLTEAAIVLPYAQDLVAELRRRGHSAGITRTDDTFVQLADRARLANAVRADAFVSLHANAASAEAANGAWVIFTKGSAEAERLARAVFDTLAVLPGVPDADPAAEVYPDESPEVGGRRLAVLRQTDMPAILVEMGFLTNAGDAGQLVQPNMRAAIVRAIADGLERWWSSRST